MHVKSILICASLIGLTSGMASAQDLTEERVREIVIETIQDNPQIVLDALVAAEENRVNAARAAGMEQITAILADPSYPRIGDPEADPAGVVFMDYNCPHCRRTHAEIETWLNAEPGRSLVMIEFPVLGAGSVLAAHVALAAQDLGMYREVSSAFMSADTAINDQNIQQILTDAGIDPQPLIAQLGVASKEMAIQGNLDLGQNLGINGTPGAVFNGQVVGGAFTAQDLDTLVN